MAQVPYSPVPTAQPTAPGESVSINTPGAAFGENIGAAISKLGSTVGEVGNELWTRAVALEQINQENIARDRQVKTAEQLTELHTNFMNLRGKEASDALPNYLEQQKEVQKNNAQGLSLFANQKYQADSLPFLQRNMFTAGAHAGDELKKYTVDSITADRDMALKQIGDDPGSFEANRQKVIASSIHAAQVVHGTYDPNDPILKDVAMNAKSAATKEFLLGIGKTNAEGAIGMMGKYRHDLTDTDYIQVQGQLEGKAAAVVASNWADRATVEIKNGAPIEKTINGLKDKAKKDYPGFEMLPSEVEKTVRTKVNIQNWQVATEQKQAYNDVVDQVLKLGIHDQQAFDALPNAQDLKDRLDPKIAADMPGFIHRINNQAYATTNRESLQIGMGMAHDPARREDFLNQDFSTWQLNSVDAEKLRQLQMKYTSDPKSAGDARVPRTMGYILNTRGEELHALGVDRYSSANADDYYKFRGALSEALDIWTEDHKRAPTPQEVVNDIAPQLIKQQVTQQGFMGSVFGSQEPAFHQWGPRPAENEVPIEFRTHLIDEIGKKGGSMPTETQVYRAYLRDQFLKLYPGVASSGGASPAKPTGKPRPGDDIPN